MQTNGVFNPAKELLTRMSRQNEDEGGVDDSDDNDDDDGDDANDGGA